MTILSDLFFQSSIIWVQQKCTYKLINNKIKVYTSFTCVVVCLNIEAGDSVDVKTKQGRNM